MDDFKKELHNHLEKFETVPFLFVGSGLSMRYLNLETWNDLLKNICNHLQLPRDYDYYYAEASGDLAYVASLVADDFKEIWWTQDRFYENKIAFRNHIKTSDSPLKIEICQYIKAKSLKIAEAYTNEIEKFKQIKLGGIVTTNWDTLLETLFQDFDTYIGQESLLFFDKIAIGDIFKIHGSVEDPNSLVLTRSDYQDFNNKNTYLAAKLLTIFVEQPVFFLGYSIDDKNIQEILKSIVSCLSKDRIEKLKDRLIFCKWERGISKPVFEDYSMFIGGAVIPMKILKLDSFIPFFEVLAERKNRLPIRILRNMQNMIYDFVKSNDSKGKIYVSDDLNKLEDEHKVEFVYGIGLKDKIPDIRLPNIGLKGITLQDLLKDVLEDKGWNHSNIATEVLPRITNSSTKYIPFFKYLRLAKCLDEKGNLVKAKFSDENFINRVNGINQTSFFPGENYFKKKNIINQKYQSLQDLIEDCSFLHCVMYIPLLEGDKIDLDILNSFLTKYNTPEIFKSSHKNCTDFRRIICLYDYLKYKLQPSDSVQFLGTFNEIELTSE